MPVPLSSNNTRLQDARPVLGHVNLMVDTLIVNANIDDLRAIVRATLASSPPGMAGTFTRAARQRLQQTNAAEALPAGDLFRTGADGLAIPTPDLKAVLVLASVVRATKGRRWKEDDNMESIFSDIDADISQALQSTREEIDGGRVADMAKARDALRELRSTIQESQRDVKGWGGVYPFERAAATLEFWKL